MESHPVHHVTTHAVGGVNHMKIGRFLTLERVVHVLQALTFAHRSHDVLHHWTGRSEGIKTCAGDLTLWY